MPGDDFPDAPPPEVPEEFAAAYRDAYRRALADDASGVPAAEVGDGGEVPPLGGVGVDGALATDDRSEGALARWRRSRWFLPASVMAGGLVVVLLAYGLGRAVSGDETRGAGPSTGLQATRTSGTARSQAPPSSTAAPPQALPPPGSYAGPVTPLAIDAVSADCTAPPGTDASGHRVDYVPGNAIDAKAQTAWRCTGTAVGQKLTLRLAGSSDVVEVGLVPGYAKTDPASGVDRYAENNRITRVRWTFADGASFVQRLDPDPSSRRFQAMRVPRTRTDTVTLEILAVRQGPRNTTAISEIRLAAPRSS